MRQTFLLLVMLSTLTPMTSCEDDSSSPDITTLIIGEWELRKSYNGQGMETEFSAGNGNIYRFSESKYERYENGILVEEGVYRLVEETSSISKETISRLLFDDEIDNPDDHLRISIEVVNNNLIIAVDANDGPSSVYDKINEQSPTSKIPKER